MKHPDNPEEELRRAVDGGRVVLVAGTGVSMGASWDPATRRPHPQASWSGLLENGLEWLKEHHLMDDDEADAHLKLIKKSPQTHRFISAAEDITEKMGGVGSVHFRDWLGRTVGSIHAHDRKVLDALEALRDHGNLLATTNYDSLLTNGHTHLKPVTWKEPQAIIGAVRDNETEKVIFLHGHWRQPDTVILDWKSYNDIARSEPYRDDLAAVWKTTTWVYVGCGVSGLGDPDFGLLLERYGARARDAGHWDFCLVKADQRDEFQAFFDKEELNICAISVGASHDDLPQFLRSLLPTPAAPPPAPIVLAGPPAPLAACAIPQAPAFYAEPDYIGSHKFVGRQTELQDLSDWANKSDPTNLLLFEAIGGNGKSMLTWEWTTKHATRVRSDWAGRFWYSFYEHGATMQDFCQHALAYTTGRPLEEFAKLKTAEMKDDLVDQLHAKPWLLILDGLERVLVAYHRIDASEVPDEEANAPTDKVLSGTPATPFARRTMTCCARWRCVRRRRSWSAPG